MDKLDLVLESVQTEYLRARKKFPAFNSTHEGYAVLLEEVDELWNEVKTNSKALAVGEAKQVAAMAVAFLVDLYGLDELKDNL